MPAWSQIRDGCDWGLTCFDENKIEGLRISVSHHHSLNAVWKAVSRDYLLQCILFGTAFEGLINDLLSTSSKQSPLELSSAFEGLA